MKRGNDIGMFGISFPPKNNLYILILLVLFYFWTKMHVMYLYHFLLILKFEKAYLA